ncbi:MAG TPA: PVC-type heme-binding CxxCH protein, partial [Flavitalea sp.]|nr:PVC-type heme-binding CxxCH protein [Flavitalea sp.]
MKIPACPTRFILARFILPILISSLILAACKDRAGSGNATNNSKDTLTEEERHLPENALKGLEVAEGLEVVPVAAEPMLKNPTNMDVDDRGRIWITEAYNYRPGINGNPTNPQGDRIIILEDLNGDGHADTTKVFYQGPEINAPLGVSVMGNRVIVSQSPYVWSFYDDNGDDKADRKELLFQGIGGEQHDHGVHSFTFGPDGKLYFNFGNEGKTLKDKNGRTVRDQDGEDIGPGKYKMGMLFRCDPDGSHVECLGDNFRNNYEAAVDSYGAIWQSDNDDDGNRGVRINYIMQYGNYGYTDEMTGAYWSANRTNIEDSIPFRHWHLNDPGVVPNLLQTGSGSPTGMVVYEGKLLPPRFINQLIHCDAGPNVVRSYPVRKAGAGYTATINNVLNGARDQWFRPADLCVAPDGSLLVADWYDPGVGGHQAGDQQRGRVYRVQPAGYKYALPKIGYSTPEEAIIALKNPNLSVRYKAFNALVGMKQSAIAPLEATWRNDTSRRMAARAFWVLLKTGNNPSQYIKEAAANKDANTRMMAIRAAKENNIELLPVLEKLSGDNDVQVLRECALALHHVKDTSAAAIWTKLATQYNGSDRWYLEALGIGADDQWDTFLAAYLRRFADPLKTAAGRDIIWRARSESAVPFLAALASDKKVPIKERLRYFRAFDFQTGPAKKQYLLGMIEDPQLAEPEMNQYVL